MSAASRRKGVTGEREVARVFEDFGYHIRGLEGGGDHFAVHTGRSFTGQEVGAFGLHIECKRQERLRLPEWLEQARTEAPPGVPPVVVFRQNHGAWYACLPLADLLGLIG